MKQIAFLFLALFIAGTAVAQDEPDNRNDEIRTIFGNQNTSHGGYGAFSINYTEINDLDGIMIGGRGCWVVNHSIGLGLGGYGFFNESVIDPKIDPTLDYEYNLGGGYGGLFIEPVIGSKYPVHVSLPVLIGVGGIAYTRNYYDYDSWDNDNQGGPEDVDVFFVVEPGVELEVNLMKFMRIAFGAHYRYTTDINLKTDVLNIETDEWETYHITENDVMNGLSFGITFKFGIF